MDSRTALWWSRHRSILHKLEYEKIIIIIIFKKSLLEHKSFSPRDSISLTFRRRTSISISFKISRSSLFFFLSSNDFCTTSDKGKIYMRIFRKASEVLPTCVVSCSMVSSFLRSSRSVFCCYFVIIIFNTFFYNFERRPCFYRDA